MQPRTVRATIKKKNEGKMKEKRKINEIGRCKMES